MRNSGRWSRLVLATVCGAAILAAVPSEGATPLPGNSWFEPEAGTLKNPVVGLAALQYFHACPNNDGGSSLPNNARVKIVLRDASNLAPSPPVPAADVYLLFNGGTAAQGFSGIGSDSIIANNTWNATCPLVTKIIADGPSDPNGVMYITFTGASGTPGVGLRDSARKWGHYDQFIPVYLDIGGVPNQLFSPLQYKAANYRLRIKNFDWTGGLAATLNQGEVVTSADFNGIATSPFVDNAVSYWKDFDDDGYVAITDFNMLTAHILHGCTTPFDP